MNLLFVHWFLQPKNCFSPRIILEIQSPPFSYYFLSFYYFLFLQPLNLPPSSPHNNIKLIGSSNVFGFPTFESLSVLPQQVLSSDVRMPHSFPLMDPCLSITLLRVFSLCLNISNLPVSYSSLPSIQTLFAFTQLLCLLFFKLPVLVNEMFIKARHGGSCHRLILALRRQKKANLFEFEDSLVYITNSRRPGTVY